MRTSEFHEEFRWKKDIVEDLLLPWSPEEHSFVHSICVDWRTAMSLLKERGASHELLVVQLQLPGTTNMVEEWLDKLVV